MALIINTSMHLCTYRYYAPLPLNQAIVGQDGDWTTQLYLWWDRSVIQSPWKRLEIWHMQFNNEVWGNQIPDYRGTLFSQPLCNLPMGMVVGQVLKATYIQWLSFLVTARLCTWIIFPLHAPIYLSLSQGLSYCCLLTTHKCVPVVASLNCLLWEG